MATLEEHAPPDPRTSAPDLPAEIREQLIVARVGQTHTIREMILWLREDQGYNVSESSLSNWFTRMGVKKGHRGDA